MFLNSRVVSVARITVEDCIERISDRFDLVAFGSNKAKLLLKETKPLLETDNREIVTALREFAEGKVEG